jgi:outer membrane protein TolC
VRVIRQPARRFRPFTPKSVEVIQLLNSEQRLISAEIAEVRKAIAPANLTLTALAPLLTAAGVAEQSLISLRLGELKNQQALGPLAFAIQTFRLLAFGNTFQTAAKRPVRRAVAICLLSAALTACETYQPEPLDNRLDLLSEVSGLTISPSDLPLPELGTHPFDPSRPLDIDEVAMIAVVNNPDLKAMRDQVGIAEAQAFAAGLLPNPSFAFAYGALLGGFGATTGSVSATLGEDIVPLLTRSARRSAASANERSVRLNLLWQEWQIVSQARTLFARAVELERQRAVIDQYRKLFSDRYQTSNIAMQQGNETLPIVVSDLAALQAVETQLHDTEQLILKNRHDLNALLGLAPETQLRLLDRVSVTVIDAARMKGILRDLARRRPDLLALAAGYESEEEKLRQAIIEQFPKLNIAPNYTNDTTPVYTVGPTFTIGLPIFDRNQGNIAIERATRRRLQDEYQARLDTAYGAADRLITELELIEAQYRGGLDSIRRLRDAAKVADQAYAAGNLDERSYVDLHASLLAKEIETHKLEQTLIEQRIALQTLIGSDIPARSTNRFSPQ